jgi:WhiB family redox-sensing transcriptional regulator
VNHEWRDDARCLDPQVDPDLFHPAGEMTTMTAAKAEQIDHAKAICATCPVWEPCLEAAIAGKWQGIAGGMTEDERHLMKRRASKRKHDQKRRYVRKARA